MMVYLIHFDRPYKHAQHYIGYTDNLDSRIDCHRHGNGSKLLKAVNAAGIGYKVVRTWPDGDRSFQRQLKNQKNASRFCPTCRKGVERLIDMVNSLQNLSQKQKEELLGNCRTKHERDRLQNLFRRQERIIREEENDNDQNGT